MIFCHFQSIATTNTCLSSKPSGFILLSCFLLHFNALCNLRFHVRIVFTSTFSDILLMLSSLSNVFNRLHDDGRLFEVFDVVFSDSISLSEILKCSLIFFFVHFLHICFLVCVYIKYIQLS